jgi:hypothetical protein
MLPSKRQLRMFLSELRGGSDIETASVVAEIPIDDARRLAAVERRGGFRHELVQPPVIIVGTHDLSIALNGGLHRIEIEYDLPGFGS